MKPNNLYYRDIAIIVTGGDETLFPKFYSSMYYMRKIAEIYNGETYSTVKSSNKYLRDWYVKLTGEDAPSTHKYNLWYLRKIAKAVYPSASDGLNENQCLHIIADNITISTSVKLLAEPSSQVYGSNITLTATVLDSDREPISGGTVTFYEGESTIGSPQITGSDGKASIQVNTLGIGTHTLKAVYDEYTGTTTVTVTKIPSTITITSDDNTYYVGQTIAISGELSVGSGKTVKLYDGNTLIDDDITTVTDGAYEVVISDATVGVHRYNVRYEGDSTHSSVISDVLPITVQAKLGAVLTIDTPALIYSDEFEVTGTLTESDNTTPISSAVITLTWDDGTSHTTTGYTDSNGEVTFSTLEATTISEYTFQLAYGGSDSHNSATSSTVAVTPDKETSVLNITAPSDNATVSGSTFTVTGTLKDNDDEVMANKNVKVKLGSTTLDTLTSDSSGVINDTVSTTGLSQGSNTIRFIFEEDSYYEESYTDRTITYVQEYDNITLDATGGRTNGILSYADYSAQSNTEYVTLTVQLMDGLTDPYTVSGVPIAFYVDDTLATTVNTNSSGQASYSYVSQGVGDITITAIPDNRSLLSETYSLEDCINYDAMTSNSGKWTIPSACSTAYDSNGAKFGTATSYSQVKLTDKLTNDCSVEFTIVDYSSSNIGTYPPVIVYQYTNGETTPNQALLISWNDSAIKALDTIINHAIVKGAVYRIDYKSSGMKVYENGTLLASGSNTVGFPTRLEFHIGNTGSRWVKVKDVKVKPL